MSQQQQQWFLGGKGSSCGAPAGNGLSSRHGHLSGQPHGSLPIRSVGYSTPGAINSMASKFKPFSQLKTDCQVPSQPQPQFQQAAYVRNQPQHLLQNSNQPQLQAGGGCSYQAYSQQTQSLSQSPNVSASHPSMAPKGLSWSQQDMIIGQNSARPGPGSAPLGSQHSKQLGASSYLQNSCVPR